MKDNIPPHELTTNMEKKFVEESINNKLLQTIDQVLVLEGLTCIKGVIGNASPTQSTTPKHTTNESLKRKM